MRKYLPLSISLFLVAISIFVWLRFSERENTYLVKGIIKGFGASTEIEQIVFIHHEKIPSYMPEMTMPFRVTDQSATKFETGDAVSFSLHQSQDELWITAVKRISPTQVSLQEDALPTSNEMRILQPKDVVPAISLVDQDHKNFQLTDFKGKIVALSFIYTRCPDPTLCPRMSSHFKTLQTKLSELGVLDKTHLLNISFDPQNDSPSVLKQYAQRYAPNTSHWTFATGSVSEIAKTAQLFGVNYRNAQGDLIEHSLTTAVLSPEGKVVKIWRGNTWKPEEVLETMQLYLKN